MSDVREQDTPSSFIDPIASLRVALRGRYEIERQIGQGAFATVYLARDLKHERKVAIKVLNADPTSDTGELRFIREIRLAARLQHPNILPLHDSGHVEALLYYVMPYVAGETLRDRIEHQRQLAVAAACTIACEIADALAYAHAQGIIHRDIKPENILISAGHPVLVDFGIARVIDLAGVRQLTRTGIGSPGTPAYMSPEQLMGDRELDGRSDTYSLGCVLYEMLAGKPPFTGKDGFARRFTEPPPRVSAARRDIPPALDEVVSKALARSPEDRFPTATEFISALCMPELTGRSGPNSEPQRRVTPTFPVHAQQPVETELVLANPDGGPVTPVYVPAIQAPPEYVEPGSRRSFVERIRSHPRRAAGVAAGVLVALVTLAATVGPTGWRAVFGAAPALDSTRFVVLPLAAESQPDRTTGAYVAEGLYDALEEGWDGLRVVEATKVAELVRKNGGGPTTQSEALAFARQLGAGQLIWGQVLSGSRIRTTLYDVFTGSSAKEIPLESPPAQRNEFAQVAVDLLKVPDRPRAADAGDGGTRTFPAWRAYGRGHVALTRWDLPRAESEFLSATEADPTYAAAHLWLAQTRALRSYGPVEAWREQAERALTYSSDLKEPDLTLARALGAMAHTEYGVACDSYQQLIARNSNDYLAWYGRGLCAAYDKALVPDERNPGSWRFRSSFLGATRAFEKATQLEPRLFTVLPFDTLLSVAPIQATQLRPGVTIGKSREVFGAYPSFVAETLAYTPFPLAEVQGGRMRTAPKTASIAAQRSRAFLLRLVTRWVREFPQSPAAYEALAILQEAGGELGPDRGGVPSALTAVQTAQKLSLDEHRRLLLVLREVRLRLKRNEFERTRVLSDSLLSSVGAKPEQLSDLAGLAALMGKLALTQRLLRPSSVLPASRDRAEPLPNEALMAAAYALFVRAALGACSENLDQLSAQIDQLLESFVPPPQREAVRADLTARSWSMAVPCRPDFALRIRSPVNRLVQMQQAFARSDPRTVRAHFDSLIKLRENDRPGDVSPDHMYQEAWLLAAIGDTAAAIRKLDLSLSALPTLGNMILDQVPLSAALVRAMVLRADLANAQGDTVGARKWARAASVLWANADPTLQPIVRRMQAMAQRSSSSAAQPNSFSRR